MGDAAVDTTHQETDWATAPLGELIGHILATHHRFMKAELPRLEVLMLRAMAAAAGRHREVLERLEHLFDPLRVELDHHMMVEETSLFPLALAAEKGAAGRTGPMSVDSLQRHVRHMKDEHFAAEAVLRRMRDLTGDYAPPPGTGGSTAALYRRLAAMEADLHEHIRIENDELAPRLAAMARATGVSEATPLQPPRRGSGG